MLLRRYFFVLIITSTVVTFYLIPFGILFKILKFSFKSGKKERDIPDCEPLNETLPSTGIRENKIGVLIPCTTRGLKSFDIHDFSLTKFSLPSLNKTIRNNYKYTIYMGIDFNDTLLSYETELKELHENIVVVKVNGSSFTKAVNTIAAKAVKDGMDYLIRMNDDLKIVTCDWISLSIDILQNNDPTNVGVVGPTCNQGNTAIFTTDFVHVTHFKIFGFYYPPQLENWWTDDWITRVYQPKWSKRLTRWEVVHTRTYGNRYTVNFDHEKLLDGLINDGNKTLIKHVEKYYVAKISKDEHPGT
ncbi:hypothetical protein ACF0H5_014054 [Mactra antiquata]